MNMKTESKPKQLWKIECDPACGFLVRSPSRDEVAQVATGHANSVHSENYKPKDLEHLVQPW
jgi:predicted small metal-binding protein